MSAATLKQRAKRAIPKPLLAGRHVVKSAWNLLHHQGLFHSIYTQRPELRDGQPIPWLTYPAISFLEGLDFSGMSVFEYGSGYSTLFWQERALSVASVEDDGAWFDHLRLRLDPARVDYKFANGREDYVDAIGGRLYDVIVIDGSHREDCGARAVDHLEHDGLIIVDNADWFPSIAAHLRANDLIEVDFTGFAPGNSYTSTTSLFLRRAVRLTPAGPQPRVGRGGMPQNVRPGPT